MEHYGCSKVRRCTTSLSFACAAYTSFAQSGCRSQTVSGGVQKLVGCPTAEGGNNTRRLPTWLQDCLQSKLLIADSIPILGDRFTQIIPTSEQLYDKFLNAFRSHVEERDCHFCMKVHTLQGEAFCTEMKDISAQAWNVPTPMLGERPTPSNSES